MSSNAAILGTLNRLLQDLQAGAPQTVLTVRAAPVLTRPDFLQRLEQLLPHSMLVELGDPSDAPLDMFPAVVSLFTGPHPAELPPGWTADGFCSALASEFHLTLPEPAPVRSQLHSLAGEVGEVEAVDRAPQVHLRRPDPFPLPEPAAVAPLTLAQLAAAVGLHAALDGPGGGDLFLIRDGRAVIFCGSERMCRTFLSDRARRPPPGGLTLPPLGR